MNPDSLARKLNLGLLGKAKIVHLSVTFSLNVELIQKEQNQIEQLKYTI